MPASAPPKFASFGRCNYTTKTGRQCRSLIMYPDGKYCPRHLWKQSSKNDFCLALADRSMDFADPRGIRNSLHTLYTLLAGGAISPRRAATLAYISKMLLQALVVIDEQENRPIHHEIVVPPRRQSFPPGPEGDAAFAQSQARYDQATTTSTDEVVSATEEGPTRDLVTDFANRLPKWKSELANHNAPELN